MRGIARSLRPTREGLGKMRLVERTFSIRTVMLTLVCGGVIVMLGAALVAGWLSYREYRDRIGSNLIATSRAIMLAVDDELDEPLAFVNGLASASSFARGDFNNFQVARGMGFSHAATLSLSSRRMAIRSTSTQVNRPLDQLPQALLP